MSECVYEREYALIMMLLVHYSPLHIAAHAGLARVVKELVNRGADLQARDVDSKATYSHTHTHTCTPTHTQSHLHIHTPAHTHIHV